MADTSSTIRVLFDGDHRGLVASATAARTAIRALASESDRLGSSATRVSAGLVSGFAKLGGVASSVQGVVGTVAALGNAVTTLAPAALALPGIILGGVAAMQTFKLATDGVADALKGDAEAMAQLAPNAQAAVRSINAFKPAFNDMRKAVQDEFFQGLNTEIEQTGKVLLPILRAELPQVAGGFQLMAKGALQAAREPFFKEDMATILGNTGEALANMAPAAGKALTGFVGLGSVGSKLLPGIGAAIDDVATKFDHWVQEGIETGRIEAMLDRAIDGFQQLGDIVGNFATAGKNAIKAFTDGLGGGSGSALDSLEQFSAKLEELSNNPVVVDAFRTLGDVVATVGDAFRTVLTAAIEEAAPIVVALGPVVKEVATAIGDFLVGAIRTAGPILQRLAGFLSEHKEVVGDLVPILLSAAAAWKAWSILTSVSGWVSGAVGALRNFGTSADDAAKKADGASKALGGLKALGPEIIITLAVLGFEAAQEAMNKVTESIRKIPKESRSSWEQVQVDLSDTLNGVFDLQSQIDNFSWESFFNPKIDFENSSVNKFLGEAERAIADFLDPKPQFDFDTAPARASIGIAVDTGNSATSQGIHDANEAPAIAAIKASQTYGQGIPSIGIHDANEAPAIAAMKASQAYGDATKSRGTHDANTGPANQQVDSFASKANRLRTESVHTVRIRTVSTSASVGASAVASLGRALGGYATPAFMASGGLREMSALRAEIVPPNQPRIIGDRMQGDEAFIPINSSARSRQILELTAQRMGFRLLADGGLLGSGSSSGARRSVEDLLRELIAAVRDDRAGDLVVALDGDPVRRIARREIEQDKRDTVRRATAGAGVTY